MTDTLQPQDSEAEQLADEIVGRITLVDGKGKCFTISESDYEWLVAALLQWGAKQARSELEHVLTHSSGGGSWRRVITQRISQLDTTIKGEARVQDEKDS